jgi:predicted naringenin-chalcone synthase
LLYDFRITRPKHECPQSLTLEWLATEHARADGERSVDRMRKLVARVACSPSQIRSRGHVLEIPNLTGATTLERTRIYEREVNAYFESAYREHDAPDDLVHVTCTGYVAPSGAQRLVAMRGWGDRTRVTHAYHMGCYAAIPALRIAAGCLATSRPGARTDVVHTELCTLHLDAAEHSAEQLVVQSLFADGFVRYSVAQEAPKSGACYEVLGASERVVPESGTAMAWCVADRGMQMTLSRDVPKIFAEVLRPFTIELLERANVAVSELKSAKLAVHPGGPRIIDGVKESLELDESQVRTSRGVLYDYGNMSSATLPHVWKRMLDDDDDLPRGSLVVSLAFGPGLTVCGAVFRKR